MHIEPRHVRRFLEFFLIGIVMGVIEDLIAIFFATDATITLEVVLIATAVALPFAVISELVVDHNDLFRTHKRHAS